MVPFDRLTMLSKVEPQGGAEKNLVTTDEHR